MPRAVVDFRVEDLAGGERLVRLDEVEDAVRHVVGRSPWHVVELLVDDDG